jgi:hypothetical protein
MRFTWKGKWKEGEVTVEAQTAKELEDALGQLKALAGLKGVSSEYQNFPQIPSMLGCTDAVRALMETDWGSQPRSMGEIKKVLEANQLYFSKEALAATLATISSGRAHKKGAIHRMKEEGKWKYFTK